ncbi:hypothetical protein GGR56DRAFT_565663 [Xylariaceae sp. FL0804]|nr:hypothetical protein GGR56DRAFT_565663 [Xylariaceae sp. FL0804]
MPLWSRDHHHAAVVCVVFDLVLVHGPSMGAMVLCARILESYDRPGRVAIGIVTDHTQEHTPEHTPSLITPAGTQDTQPCPAGARPAGLGRKLRKIYVAAAAVAAAAAGSRYRAEPPPDFDRPHKVRQTPTGGWPTSSARWAIV